MKYTLQGILKKYIISKEKIEKLFFNFKSAEECFESLKLEAMSNKIQNIDFDFKNDIYTVPVMDKYNFYTFKTDRKLSNIDYIEYKNKKYYINNNIRYNINCQSYIIDTFHIEYVNQNEINKLIQFVKDLNKFIDNYNERMENE